MQVVVKPSFYPSFGGINFMDADFRSLRLAAPINEQLGQRSANAQYRYADVIRSLAFMFSMGGEVPDDLNTLQQQTKDHPCLPICSPTRWSTCAKSSNNPRRSSPQTRGSAIISMHTKASTG